MNKQELIEEIKGLRYHNASNRPWVDRGLVLDLVEQLDEPQKVQVPQFVAEKIEYFKKTGDWDLFQAMDYSFGEKDIREWLEVKNNQETFARAWLDGYTVEEKRYLVKMKGMQKDCVALKKNKDGGYWYLSDTYPYGSTVNFHTRKELEEAGFGWVFDCEGIDIEEVEG